METDRVTCECGCSEVGQGSLGTYFWVCDVEGIVFKPIVVAVRRPTGKSSVGYCFRCGARLSFAEDGTPVARRMVPEDETVAEAIERQQADPAKSGLQAMVGQWPGDETDAEVVLAVLEGEDMVPRAVLDRACAFLAANWDCPWQHTCGDIPCLEHRWREEFDDVDCDMSDEQIGRCWARHFADGGDGYKPGGGDGERKAQ